jgi:alpha-mannosidase
MKRKLNWSILKGASIAVVCLTAMSPILGRAQTHHFQIEEIVDKLPPADRTTVQRLGELNQFDAGEWRHHSGDVPHGESVDLNDSDWQLTAPKGEVPAEAVWYRRWIEIPKTFHGYDATGTRIWFRFEASADDDVPEIIYFNGRRVALGADLEPIVLTESAKPGDRILVAVKLLATAGPKTVRGAALRVDYPENRPNPGDLRDEVLSCVTLIPTLSKDPSADEATLSKAIAAIDVHALDTPGAAGQQRFDASLRAAEQQLEAHAPAGDIPRDRQLAYRRRMAMAVDRNGRRSASHLRHRRATPQ